MEKTEEIVGAAQDKVEDMEETGGRCKTMVVEDAGKKLEVVKEAMKGMKGKVAPMKEKVTPKKDDGGAAKNNY